MKFIPGLIQFFYIRSCHSPIGSCVSNLIFFVLSGFPSHYLVDYVPSRLNQFFGLSYQLFLLVSHTSSLRRDLLRPAVWNRRGVLAC